MKAADKWLVLGNHADSKYEKTALEHYMQEKGQLAIYKLNPIEVKPRGMHELFVIIALWAWSVQLFSYSSTRFCEDRHYEILQKM